MLYKWYKDRTSSSCDVTYNVSLIINIFANEKGIIQLRVGANMKNKVEKVQIIVEIPIFLPKNTVFIIGGIYYTGI